MFPIPIEVFAPDGTSVYMNYAFMELNNIRDRSLAIGKYNVLNDPIMKQLGLGNDMLSAFYYGEKGIFKGFQAPAKDLVERKVVTEKPFKSAILDIYYYPVFKDKKLIFVVCVFCVRNLYFGRPDVARAKEYIDTHWQGEFHKEKLSKAVGMSVAPLYKLFKEHTGITPGDYHKKVKIERLKEKLTDKCLSIKEAFAACGEDSQGRIAKVFKEITGMSPTEFRKGL